MQINGKAIYDSRPFRPYKSGKICFTASPDKDIFLIYLAGVGELNIPEIIEVSGFQPPEGAEIELLGNNGKLTWKKGKDTGFIIKVPAKLQQHPPCKHAWTFKIVTK
jgi:hypothetical protein